MDLQNLKLLYTGINPASQKQDKSNNINLDNINKQLEEGNKTILQELDKYNISYTLTETTDGYTVQYSYDGVNYTIKYNQPNNKKEIENITLSVHEMLKMIEPAPPD